MNEFEKLEAVSLYCRQCAQAMPVRKRLLLVLLDHELYEYICTGCSGSLGQKKEPLPPITLQPR